MLDYSIRYNYYVNVLCENKDNPESNCNGKCHLSKVLKDDSSQQEPNEPSLVEYKTMSTEPEVNLLLNEDNRKDESNSTSFFYLITLPVDVYLPIPTPPPQIVS